MKTGCPTEAGLPSSHSGFQFTFISKAFILGAMGLLIMVFGDIFFTLEDPLVMDSIFVSSQNSHVEALNPSVMIIRA